MHEIHLSFKIGLRKDRLSGATYSSFSVFRATCSRMDCWVFESWELLKKFAGTPFALSPSTWSFISAMSGEITSVSPSKINAGIWKQSDLPPPVGMMTKVSLFSRTLRIIFSWSGRKVSYPKYFFKGVYISNLSVGFMNLLKFGTRA